MYEQEDLFTQKRKIRGISTIRRQRMVQGGIQSGIWHACHKRTGSPLQRPLLCNEQLCRSKAAAEGLDPTDYSYDDPETPPSPESRERSGGGIYPNPGATLKGIATLICVLGMVASVILAVVFGYSTSLLGDFNFGLFFGILIGGGILSYLSGLGLAAFGDLVLSANEIKRKLK